MFKETLNLSCEEGFCPAPENMTLVKAALKNDPLGENVSTRTVGRPCTKCLEIKKIDASLIGGIQKILSQNP